MIQEGRESDAAFGAAEGSPGKSHRQRAHHRGIKAIELVFELELVLWAQAGSAVKIPFWLLLSILTLMFGCASGYHGEKPAQAQAIQTTVADILVNPDKYDGKLVQIQGWVSSLQFNASRAGPYTTFELGNQSGRALSLVNLGILPIKEGDFVSVTVRYNKSDKLIWIYSLEGPGNR